MGGSKARKIEILDGFLNMLFEPIILVKIYLIFSKIDAEKHMDFVLFFVLLFVFFLNAQNLKNRAPVEAGAQFLQNRDFR